MNKKQRSGLQKLKDFITFPIRAITLFHEDRFGLSCLASERFDYVASEIDGYNLDIGCGYHNRFTTEFLKSNGVGLDIFKYEGLNDSQIVSDFSNLPYTDGTFDSITYIANINHCPRPKRDAQLAEAYRLVKDGGKIVVTMGNPLAEILVHKVVYFYDKFFKTKNDMDTERGMDVDEEYYLLDKEIIERLQRAGFKNVRKKYFITQWFLNHMFIATK